MNIKIITSYKPIREAILNAQDQQDDPLTAATEEFIRQHELGHYAQRSVINIHAHWSTHSTGEHFITDIIVRISDALPDFEAIEDAIADWDWETRGFEFDFNSDNIKIERFVDPDRGRSKSTVQWENT